MPSVFEQLILSREIMSNKFSISNTVALQLNLCLQEQLLCRQQPEGALFPCLQF